MTQQQSRVLTIMAVLGVLVLLVVFFSTRSSDESPTPTSTIPGTTAPTSTAPTPTPPIPTSTTPAAQPTSTTPGAVRVRPDGTMCDAQNFICVSQTYRNVQLENPMIVTGTALAFESTFSWELKDANGRVIEKGFTMTAAPDIGKPGAFTIRHFFVNVPTTNNGTLTLLEYSARDGSPTHILNIPVRLPRQTMSVKIFLPPADAGTDCSVVVGVNRTIPRTIAPAEAALRELLELKMSDTVSGSHTQIPDDAELISLIVNDGNAKAVFNDALDSGVAGSCRVVAIRTQIEQTLKQFSSIRTVEISTQLKNAAETLQP